MHAAFQARERRQRGAASLLFILIAALGLMAVTAMALQISAGTQKIQYAEHTNTQADMEAWTGVNLLSAAVAALPASAALTPNSAVTLSGVQPGISVLYVGPSGNNLLFRVTGSSGGATSTLSVALAQPSPGSSSNGSGSFGSGEILNGPTTITGSVNYSGSGGAPVNLSVLGGSLTMSGSVTGLNQVCATGDISISSAITANSVCSNGAVTLSGSATVGTISAIGNVTLQGGASGTLGTINSNGAVTLSGGSATATTINATGPVTVSGNAASAGTVNTEGNIGWTSSAAAGSLNANGTVVYATTAGSNATTINAIGNVSLTQAQTVNSAGNVQLTGYWGQGVAGSLNAQGQLSGSSWGSYGGAVVGAGTVGSMVSPAPATVKVAVKPGYTVNVPRVTIPAVPPFTLSKPTVDAYQLRSQANLVFTGVDKSGNPVVLASNIAGISNGSYYIAQNSALGSMNWLCSSVSGGSCSSPPLARICQGFSNANPCFSLSGSTWTLQGTTALPLVMWFQGDLDISSGTWPAALIASGNISTSGNATVYAPNYPASTFACQGQADSANTLAAWSSNGLSTGHYATQLCTGSPPTLSAAQVGNIALLAGGYTGTSFSGGNISLGASNNIYGAILAGQYFSSSGSTTVAGTIYAGAQNSSASGGNSQGGSTTIIAPKGSSAYQPGNLPCMGNCPAPSTPANNIVWVSPV